MQSHNLNSQKLAIILAMLAGFIDALGFLNLGGVFVSFMSGNSTRFAVDLSGRTNFSTALLPLGIIAIFVLGVMIGRFIRHFFTGKPSTALLTFMLFVLTIAGLLHEIGMTRFSAPLLALAMGTANNIFFKDGEVSVGVTYMTGTLVKFGQRLAGSLLGEKDNNWLPYLLLWAGLVTGAILGSLGYVLYGFPILGAGIVVCFILAVIFARIESDKIKNI